MDLKIPNQAKPHLKVEKMLYVYNTRWTRKLILGVKNQPFIRETDRI